MTSAAAPPTAGLPENRGAVGAYKDFQIHKLNKDVELYGTDKFKPASYPHYLPSWENEKGVKYVPFPTTCMHQDSSPAVLSALNASNASPP